MAKITKNGLSGSVGGLVFRSMPDGSTWVSAKPDFSQRKLSKGQKEHHGRFQEAARYAREAARAQPIYAELAKGTVKTAYNIALSDWFHPPVIHQVKRRGGRVLVEASDDVIVTKVQITILDEEGRILEKGEGIRGEGDWWEYISSSGGKTIMVEVWDLAGNTVEFVYKNTP